MEKLSVNLRTLDEKAMFSIAARENPDIIVDYFPPVGTGKGYTSLELIMASFGSCISTTVLGLLRYRMQKTVNGLSAEVHGNVRDSHPKALACMKVLMHIKACDLTDAEVHQALTVAEESMCPVWAMLKGNVKIEIDVDITE